MFRFVFLIGLFAIVLCPRHSTAQERREAAAKVDKFVTLYASRIHYVEAGSGAPLILVHGLADNRPTLIIWGRDDKLIALSFGERFHQEIANSQLRIIDSCGHMPQVECPDEFASAVLQFFSDVK